MIWSVVKVAEGSARLTHSHADAISGAVLQCRAVWQALNADHQKGIDIDIFIADLKEILQDEEAAKLTDLHSVTRYLQLICFFIAVCQSVSLSVCLFVCLSVHIH